MLIATPKAHRFCTLSTLLICMLFAPAISSADTIIIADVEVIRTDDTGPLDEKGTLIVEDEVMLLVTPLERIAFQDEASRRLVEDTIVSAPPKKSLRFTILISGDDLQLTLGIVDEVDYVIIEDYIVL